MNLDYQRRRAEAKLRESCSVEEPGAWASDGKGGRIPGTPQIHLYPCTFRAASGNIERGGDKQLLKGAYKVRLPVDARAGEGWTLKFSDRSYTIVWAPPVGEQSLTRIIGVDPAA